MPLEIIERYCTLIGGNFQFVAYTKCLIAVVAVSAPFDLIFTFAPQSPPLRQVALPVNVQSTYQVYVLSVLK